MLVSIDTFSPYPFADKRLHAHFSSVSPFSPFGPERGWEKDGERTKGGNRIRSIWKLMTSRERRDRESKYVLTGVAFEFRLSCRQL